MDYLIVGITIAAVFGLCFLTDFLFKKIFRSQAQHMSGLAVRLHKRHGSFGLIMIFLGVGSLVVSASAESAKWLFLGGGILIALVGIFLVVYYLATGIFYDDDGFIYTTLRRRKKFYAYRDIQSQQLYNNGGHLLIELHMKDGTSVQVQSTMTGAVEFMDYAFAAWLRQTGRAEEDCEFHDPSQSVWFPPVEV